MSRKRARRLNANRRATTERAIRDIESQLALLREMIDRGGESVSDPTMEYWLTMARDHLKHLF
jgi:hypothetical protein